MAVVPSMEKHEMISEREPALIYITNPIAYQLIQLGCEIKHKHLFFGSAGLYDSNTSFEPFVLLATTETGASGFRNTHFGYPGSYSLELGYLRTLLRWHAPKHEDINLKLRGGLNYQWFEFSYSRRILVYNGSSERMWTPYQYHLSSSPSTHIHKSGMLLRADLTLGPVLLYAGTGLHYSFNSRAHVSVKEYGTTQDFPATSTVYKVPGRWHYSIKAGLLINIQPKKVRAWIKSAYFPNNKRGSNEE